MQQLLWPEAHFVQMQSEVADYDQSILYTYYI